MTTLLIQTESTPMTINLPTIAPMTHEQFYEFCLANRDLRIERTASGEVVIMPPAFSDTGNRNFNIAVQLGSWANQDGTGLGFDSSAGFTLPNGATRSPDASWIRLERWNALTEEQKASFAPICPDFKQALCKLCEPDESSANLPNHPARIYFRTKPSLSPEQTGLPGVHRVESLRPVLTS